MDEAECEAYLRVTHDRTARSLACLDEITDCLRVGRVCLTPHSKVCKVKQHDTIWDSDTICPNVIATMISLMKQETHEFDQTLLRLDEIMDVNSNSQCIQWPKYERLKHTRKVCVKAIHSFIQRSESLNKCLQHLAAAAELFTVKA
jgi:hypothetical protein